MRYSIYTTTTTKLKREGNRSLLDELGKPAVAIFDLPALRIRDVRKQCGRLQPWFGGGAPTWGALFEKLFNRHPS